jgi:hypothetical protein
MPAVVIPVLTGYVSAVPEFIDNNVRLVPPGGGVVQTLYRLGSRWALNVALPVAKEGPNLRALTTAILTARSAGASYPWPQPGLVIGTPGSPLVNGAGQAGTALILKSVAAGYGFQVGQAISILTGGRRYLHLVTAAATASGGGAVTLAIYPMLRASPANNAPVEVAAPVIEGDITRENFSWEHDRDDFVPLAFRIEEVA